MLRSDYYNVLRNVSIYALYNFILTLTHAYCQKISFCRYSEINIIIDLGVNRTPHIYVKSIELIYVTQSNDFFI